MKRHAFSLVELSIVLVILGLLIGGIFAGKSLIRASELRSITTQQSQFLTATNSFRDKYFAIPGDFNNAQAIWGIADPTPATCITTAGTGTQTCNGSGNGIIENPSSSSNETYRFWQHLVNAGLIEGQYDGITHGSNAYSSTAANSPPGKIGNTLWFTVYWYNGFASMFDGFYGNVLEFGAARSNGDPSSGALTPAELWGIDTKMDDGKPAVGKLVVRGAGGLIANCTDTSTSSNLAANYLLTSDSLGCAAIFRQQF